MKNPTYSCFYKRSMLSVGFLCLLLPLAARGQTKYNVRDLGTLGGSNSTAYGINDFGQVVGQSNISGDATGHAFLYSGGHMLDLTPGGSNSAAYGINDFGQVIGQSNFSG